MTDVRMGRVCAAAAFTAEGLRIAVSGTGGALGAVLALGLALAVGYGAGRFLFAAAARLVASVRGPAWWPVLATGAVTAVFGAVRTALWPALPVGSIVAATLVLLCLSLAVPSWREGEATSRLSTLFLVSGFSALVYQITWQRALLTSFGVNIESVTVVVSLFMVGLGVGAALGGRLSGAAPGRLPWIFMGAELGIGILGVLSIPVIEAAGERFVHLDLPGISAVTYLLLGIPTLLMGATLPVLVAYVSRVHANAGVSVSLLYALNTAGAALACLVTTDLLLGALGLRATTWVAAAFNVLVALLTLGVARDPGPGVPAEDVRPDPGDGLSRVAKIGGVSLALVVGWISLSQEILWVRAVGYATGSDPRGFGHVLGAFLVGLAGASVLALRISRRARTDALRAVGAMLLISGPVYAASIPVVSWLGVWDAAIGHLAMLVAVGIVAFLLGGAFPLLCRYVVTDPRHSGSQVAGVYVANIVGATLGPLVTGFVLLDVAPLRDNVLGLAAATMVVGIAVTAAAGVRRGRALALGAAAAVVIAGFGASWSGVLERLHFGPRYGPDVAYRRVIQNRSGIIALHDGPTDPEHSSASTVVYGGGAYDGHLSVDPIDNENKIRRAYMAAVLHPRPRRLLVIGLGGGAWARAVMANPAVEEAVFVEINPGYEQILSESPLMAPLLTDPRVTMVVDDGRRWLRRNPDVRFDLVVANTTFHRRSFAANLLSKEFFEEVRAHLSPGGFLLLNPTGSRDVARTAAEVFAYVATVELALAMGPAAPADRSPEERMESLVGHLLDGTPIFAGEEGQAIAAHLATHPLENEAPALKGDASLRVITDDNLGAEYRAF